MPFLLCVVQTKQKKWQRCGDDEMSWVLIFVMLTESGELNHTELDRFNSMDSCFEAVQNYIDSIGEDPRPWNWDMLCLEDIRKEA